VFSEPMSTPSRSEAAGEASVEASVEARLKLGTVFSLESVIVDNQVVCTKSDVSMSGRTLAARE
jgi:hypothetical protein